MKKSIILSFILFISTIHTVLAGTIHLFIVVEPDPQIGSTTDVRLLRTHAANIATITGLTLNVKEYTKKETRYVADLGALQMGDDDVVWFVYTGHGRNYGNGWPCFTVNGQQASSTDIYEQLKNKPARLKIVMFDACNGGATTTAWDKNNNAIGNAYLLLFKKAKGNILISSASDGKYSYGSPDFGGFMTASLLKAMSEVPFSLQNDNASTLWTKVLEKTRDEANRLCTQAGVTPQNPKWKLDVSGTSSESIAAPEGESTVPEKPNTTIDKGEVRKLFNNGGSQNTNPPAPTTKSNRLFGN